MKRASETDAEDLEPENSERPSSSRRVVIPCDVPMGGTMDVEDVNASLGEGGRQDVFSESELKSIAAMQVELGAAPNFSKTLSHSAPTHGRPRLGFTFLNCEAQTRSRAS